MPMLAVIHVLFNCQTDGEYTMFPRRARISVLQSSGSLVPHPVTFQQKDKECQVVESTLLTV